MFIFSQNRDAGNTIAGFILCVIGIVVVSLRYYTRTVLTRSFGSDDIFIFVPTVISTFEAICELLSFLSGYGQHESTLTPTEIINETRWSYTGWLIAFISFFFIRGSVMLFVLRLLPPNKKWQARLIHFLFFLNFAITVIACVSYGVSCRPFRANWDKTIPDAKCLSDHILIVSQQVNGILACVIDITTALIPELLLWKVKMRRSTKLVLNVIFGLGIVTAALSIGRAATTSTAVFEEDTTWREIPSEICSVLEEKFGIILASCPALRQFIVHCIRQRSVKPSSRLQEPDADFVKMRQRIKARDILWYRKKENKELPLAAGPGSARERVPSPEEPEAQDSALDVFWAKFSGVFRSPSPSRHSPSGTQQQSRASTRDARRRGFRALIGSFLSHGSKTAGHKSTGASSLGLQGFTTAATKGSTSSDVESQQNLTEKAKQLGTSGAESDSSDPSLRHKGSNEDEKAQTPKRPSPVGTSTTALPPVPGSVTEDTEFAERLANPKATEGTMLPP